MWSGAVDAVPDAWALCDGGTYTAPDGTEVTTPDLRDRFIVGAGGNKDIGDTGGADTVTPGGSISNTTAGGTVGATTLAVGQIPAHNHTTTLAGWESGSGSTAGLEMGGTGTQMSLTVTSNNAGGDGSHTHAFTGTAHGHTFTGTAQDNRPPYYALAFIMKL